MGLFSEANALVSLIERFSKKNEGDTETVADRFVRLFEKHGVHRNQIPRFFGQGLTFDDVKDTQNLLPKLNHELLKRAATTFNIRMEWLEGADDQIYEINYFYKYPEDFKSHLEKLGSDESYRLHLKLIISSERHHEEDALLIIDEPIAKLGDKTIVRHHICGGWSYRYYKCRADIAACIGISEQLKVMITRTHSVHVDMSIYCQGEAFISDLYAQPSAIKRTRLLKRKAVNFHPDELLTHPTRFIDDLYDGLWGQKSALDRWLYYFDKGYIDSKYYSRTSFSKYLEELG